ncbi:MAG: ROK family protein [Prolixibacteraceae bacterium]|jgi:glucokinase|nr:ROK family protein [Prolixibacteraceae bacterium]
MKLTVGIDIGGTNTAIGIVNERGEVVNKISIPTPSHGEIEKYIDEIAQALNELSERVKAEHRDAEILGIGVGAPNGNFYKGTIEYAPNLSFDDIVPFVDLLKKKFTQYETIVLTNDANAAAIGEMIYGGAKDMKNFVMFTLGTGVGSGLVVNGEMVYGADGFAGECGHTMLIPGGRKCGCGIDGHLEAYCSASGMKRTAIEIIARDNAADSILAYKTFNELDSKEIYEAAVADDKVAIEVFEKTGHWLGMSLADTVHHLSPEAIFLFGGPTAAGDYIFKPTIESLNNHLLPMFKNKIEVKKSELNLGDAAIVGASALVWKTLV